MWVSYGPALKPCWNPAEQVAGLHPREEDKDMAKVKVEFINTCSSCVEIGRTIQDVAAGYGDDVDVKLYVAGRDFDYLKKYGMVCKGTMIINGKTKYDNLNREIIEKAIDKAVREADDA